LIIDDDFPAKVVADQTKIVQILTNLLGNAIKFTPHGKSVWLKCSVEADHLVFVVEDHGIGMTEDEIARVFEPFEQADGSITRVYGGTGLGLAISRHLISLMDGELTVESKHEDGSKFIMSIPLVKSNIAEGATEEDLLENRFDSSNDVLVVEDNPMNWLMIDSILQELGVSARMAEDGREGVKAAMEKTPDLLLMDLHMPLMDGLEATRAIRKIPRLFDVPIVALSADAFTEKSSECLAAGMNEFLTKPVVLEKLIPLLKTYLRPVSSPKDDEETEC